MWSNILNQPIPTQKIVSLINRIIPKHFWYSIGLTIVAFYTLFIIDFSINNSNLFGFYFATPAQTYAHILLSTLIGVAGATYVVNKKISENSSTTTLLSTAWFLGFHVIVLLSIFNGRTSYGITPTEQVFEQIPLSLLSVVLYFTITRLFLKKV